jgi:hypothetical protein
LAEGFEGDITEWIASLIGETGARGAEGPQGPEGAAGANGTNGAEGPQGPQGEPGTNGSNGAEGPRGPQGEPGVEGPQGPAGADAFSGSSITLGSGVVLSESTDRADLLSVTSSTSGWGGLQITNTSGDGIWSFMVDGAAAGIYDDQQGDWAIYCVENSYVELRHNGAGKLATTSGGVSVTGAITATGDVTAFSDARVKENVETIPNALESVKQMRGVTYNKIGEEKQSIGVIAQELEEVTPQLVHNNEDGMKSVAYGNITAVLIEALKEQQTQIEELKAKLDGLTK